MPVGSGPYGIAFDGDYIWVAQSEESTLAKINPADATVIRTRALTPNSFSEALAFDGQDLWVANAFSGTVSRVRPF